MYCKAPEEAALEDQGPRDDREILTSGTPRWVKIFAAVTLTLIVLVVILLVAGRGHGPGRHVTVGDRGALAGAISSIGRGDRL